MPDRPPHPILLKAKESLLKGRLSRRQFVTVAALLGGGAAVGLALRPTGSDKLASSNAVAKPGGTLRISMNVLDISDPATADWSQKGNLTRQILEPLVRAGADNIIRPHLAERWEASDDLKIWTFHLRQGVRWSNGDPFNADDVTFNMRRWLDPATGSSNLSRFVVLAGPQVVEKIDAHTVRFHLTTPDIAFPVNFSDYPALLVHRRFTEEGGSLIKNPVGTGPFALTEFSVGDRARFHARPDYWGNAPRLSELLFVDHGDEPAAQLAALASDQVDINYESSVDQVDTIEQIPHLELLQTVTSTTGVARMKVTAPPFDNLALRQAIRACVDHERMLELAYRGYGALAEDHHVAPIHPAYAPLPAPTQDYAKAKALLVKAGHPNGLSIAIDCVANPTWEQNACKALADMLRPAGIDLAINILPGPTYWDRWLTTPFGFTAWQHRPIATQTLNLAYRSGAGWNESAYANPAFDSLLDEAMATLDPEARRPIMAKLQKLLQDDSVISQSLWRTVFVTTNKRVRNYQIHPALEMHFENVWLEPRA